jgi:hypothetical protein
MAGVKAPPRQCQLFQLTCWPMGHKVKNILQVVYTSEFKFWVFELQWSWSNQFLKRRAQKGLIIRFLIVICCNLRLSWQSFIYILKKSNKNQFYRCIDHQIRNIQFLSYLPYLQWITILGFIRLSKRMIFFIIRPFKSACLRKMKIGRVLGSQISLKFSQLVFQINSSTNPKNY